MVGVFGVADLAVADLACDLGNTGRPLCSHRSCMYAQAGLTSAGFWDVSTLRVHCSRCDALSPEAPWGAGAQIMVVFIFVTR